MNDLAYKDDEASILIQKINENQIIFHPQYVPEGRFSINGIIELQKSDKDIFIIVDKNLISPICEIVKSGTLKDNTRLQKAALFVTWIKFLNARATCGIGMIEDDTAGLSTISGEESRQRCLYGMNCVPSQIWKDIAFGYRDRIPSKFLFTSMTLDDSQYNFCDEIHLLNNEAAIIKIVELLRKPSGTPIEKFDHFARWYADHLYKAESVLVYATMVFKDTNGVSKPKSCMSHNFENVVKGIKNQAWDMTYITHWSTSYYNENDNEVVMFATDDVTQKYIIVNILPTGQSTVAINAAFSTKSESKVLENLISEKFGTERIQPFVGKSQEEKVTEIKHLIDVEYKALKEMVSS